MLAFAKKLNDQPALVTDDDVASLHAAGLTDEQVWELTFTVSIFNMFNRMADAFGLLAPAQATAALERD
jgi:alkylhydroperoxidase family enzyme